MRIHTLGINRGNHSAMEDSVFFLKKNHTANTLTHTLCTDSKKNLPGVKENYAFYISKNFILIGIKMQLKIYKINIVISKNCKKY